MTIPQQVAALIAQRPHTAADLCVAIYGTCEAADVTAMYKHIHRAKLIAPIVSATVDDGARVSGKSVVEYRMESIC
jgi:hypothetical protein